MTANNIQEVLNMCKYMWDTKIIHDHVSSARAGYPIYRDENVWGNYVCDLGSRAEINSAYTPQSINIQIMDITDLIHEHKAMSTAIDKINGIIFNLA